MKKILAILLIISTVLSFASCGNERGYIEFPEVVTEGGNTSSGWHGDAPYRTLEDVCAVSTDVVVATCTGSRNGLFTFDVQEVLLGDAKDKISMHPGSATQIYTAFSSNTGEYRSIYYYANQIYFYEGTTYLLILQKSTSVYSLYGSVYYSTMCATTIDLDNLAASKMYNESIIPHIRGIDITACTKEEMVEYVCGLVKDNRTKESVSDAETLEEIIRDSTDVIEIKIKNPVRKTDTSYKKSEVWECQIIETLKGDFEEGSMVKIEFFADEVIPNKKYIVALDSKFKILWESLTTKDSLRPVSEKETIKSYITQNN